MLRRLLDATPVSLPAASRGASDTPLRFLLEARCVSAEQGRPLRS